MVTREPEAGNYTLGDMTVNRIGFGAKRLGRCRDHAALLLRRAVDLGVDHIDTAAWYPTYADASHAVHDSSALHWANDLIRETLRPYPKDLVIATKVGPTENGLATPDQMRALVEANLRALGRDHLDLVYLRQHGLQSITEHFAALAQLREAGLIRHLGLSNVRLEHLAQAQAVAPVVAVQNRYGVDFGRVNDEMLAVCGSQGIAFVPFFALAGIGREVGGVVHNDAVSTFARTRGVSPAQVRLAWTLSRGPHVLAIPGTSRLEHLAENLRAGALIQEPDLVALPRQAVLPVHDLVVRPGPEPPRRPHPQPPPGARIPMAAAEPRSTCATATPTPASTAASRSGSAPPGATSRKRSCCSEQPPTTRDTAMRRIRQLAGPRSWKGI